MSDLGSTKPNSGKRSFAKKTLTYLLVISVSLVAVHLIFQYLNMELFYQQNGQIYELSNRFDLDDEASVPTWFSQALFLLIAGAAWLASRLETKGLRRRFWKLVAGIGLLFSIDEVAGLHERLLQTVHVVVYQDSSPTNSDNAWLLIAPVLVLLGIWLLWTAWRALPARVLGLFALAGFVFVSGAVAVDLLTNAAPRETFLNQGVLVAVEEVMELIGSSIALFAILDYIETKRGKSIRQAWQELKIKSKSGTDK